MSLAEFFTITNHIKYIYVKSCENNFFNESSESYSDPTSELRKSCKKETRIWVNCASFPFRNEERKITKKSQELLSPKFYIYVYNW